MSDLPRREPGESVAADMARTASDLRSSGYSEPEISQALAADELTIELLQTPQEPPR